MRIRVECDAGRADGLQRFVLGERTIEVTGLLDRWYGDCVDYFRVRDTDGHLYVLKHLRGDDRWELTSFTRRGSRGTGVGMARPQLLH